MGLETNERHYKHEKEMKGTYWECQLCKCSWSGECDWKELVTHLDEDHGRDDVWLAPPDVFEDLFHRVVFVSKAQTES